MADMQLSSGRTHSFWSHGEHGYSCLITREAEPRGAKRSGVFGPKSATTGVPTAAAICIGPLSLPMKSSAF